MCEFDGEMRELGGVPEALLRPLDKKIAEDRSLWIRADMVKPNRFAAFKGSTLHIVFQYPVDLRSHEESRYMPLWDAWRDALEPLIDHATAGYGYERGRTARVMLARLLKGRTIARHVDGSGSAAVPHKIHVPLTTNPLVRFLVGEGEYALERGKAYEVNNRLPHSVHNDGTESRVHLIFDYFGEP